MPSIARAETSVDLFLIAGILGLIVFLIYKGSDLLSWFTDSVTPAIQQAVASAQAAPQAIADATNPNSPTSAITQTTIASAFGAGFGIF